MYVLHFAISIILTLSSSYQTAALSTSSASYTRPLLKSLRIKSLSINQVNCYRCRTLNVALSCSNDKAYAACPASSPLSSNIENDDDTYLHNLNKDQFAAVTADLRDIRVQAGPGSGKTRVLVNRVAYMIKHLGVHPRSILAVTFTKKAANEMKDRLGLIMNDNYENDNIMVNKVNINGKMNQIKCTTLHSFCASILRQYSDKTKKDFSVYDDQDSKKIIKNLLIEKGIDITATNPGKVRNAISMIKRENLSKLKLNGSTKYIYSNPLFIIANDLLNLYNEALRINNAKDFDDLIIGSYLHTYVLGI
jgi:hypothetical protein